MLKAIFYARFHPERGPSVIHQYPDHSIRSSQETTLLTWSNISAYIIPPYDLCNQSLSICTNGYRVLGHPISLEDDKYDRNRFTFNVCFVLSEDEDPAPREQIVRKTARFFRTIEETDGLLQAEETLKGLKWAGDETYPAKDVGILRGMLERMMGELNAYGEACVRINAVHVLNLRLEVQREAPPKIRAWDVPLLIRSLSTPAEWTWDLTLQRIYTLVDGIRHTQKIAEMADVELKLVKKAIQELVFHGRAMLLDIFHFQAIYTCSDSITVFIQETELQDECRKYVAINQMPTQILTREEIIELYCLLQPGYQLSDFCLTYRSRIANIDIRRFITFGVIKGLLRRVHKYAIAIDSLFPSPTSNKDNKNLSSNNSNSPSPQKQQKSNEAVVKEFDRAWRKAALTSGWATPPSAPTPGSLGKSHKSAERARDDEDERLRGYLDGRHCMDQICVGMHLSERKVVERLRSGRFGEVILFNK